MNFSKFIVSFVLTLFCSTSFAIIQPSDLGSAGWDKLTESQKADLIKNVEYQAKRSDGPAAVVPTVDEAKKWSDVGISIAQGISGAAKEFGVAVNDFAKTTVGKWTLALIVWYVLGHTVLHVIGGVFVLGMGLLLITIMYKRNSAVTKEYSQTETTRFGGPKLIKTIRPPLSPDAMIFICLFGSLSVFVSLVCIFTG